MQAFETHKGVVAVLDRANVDTDQIIPKQFLKSIHRTGFGEHCFEDWRYNEDGSENPDFELNRPEFKGATVLVTGNNFGCGSSREHAVWAVMQAGYRAVIAPWVETDNGRVPGFADIFRGNSEKCGLLTIQLPSDDVKRIVDAVSSSPGIEATVDLDAQQITVHAGEPFTLAFEVDPTVRRNLLEGLDEIGLTLAHESSISAYEKQTPPYSPREDG